MFLADVPFDKGWVVTMANRRKVHGGSTAPEDRSEGQAQASLRDQPTKRLARGFQILRSFQSGDEFLTNGEIARRTELPKPTVSRISAMLVSLGYMTYDPVLGTYRLGAALLQLAKPLLSAQGIQGVAQVAMRELADETGLTVGLGRRVGYNIIYVAAVRGANPIMLDLGIGSAVPIVHTAMGRVYLATCPEDEREALLDHIAETEGLDREQIGNTAELAIQSYRTYGYCTTLGEWNPDVNAVGAAIICPGEGDIMPIMCGGPASQLSAAAIRETVGSRVRDIADSLSAASPEGAA